MAKYNDVTMGQMEACINRMGGLPNFLDFIGGQGRIVFESVLSFSHTIVLPAQPAFSAHEQLFINECHPQGVSVAQTWNNFIHPFLNKVERPTEKTGLVFHKIGAVCTEERIISQLVANKMGKIDITLSQLFALLLKQGNGEEGDLLLPNKDNRCYILDVGGNLQAVNARWSRTCKGWLLSAHEADSPHKWENNGQVITRN